MIENSLRTAVPVRPGTAEYHDLIRRARTAATALTRALQERRGVSAVRRAYADVDDALGRAIEYARGQVRGPHMPAGRPVPPPLDNAAAQAWNADLWRLRDLREQLRFQALDDPRSSLPDTVRVATRAATGPRMPALRVADRYATAPAGEGMGIDLVTVLDRASADRTAPGSGPAGQRGRGVLRGGRARAVTAAGGVPTGGARHAA